MKDLAGIDLSLTQIAGFAFVNRSFEQQARSDTPKTAPERPSLWRIAPLALLVLLGAFVFVMGWHRELTLETLVRHRMTIADFVDAHLLGALATFTALYVVVVSLSLPGATILTIVGGLLFGAVIGGLAATVSATLGATVIFLIARSAIGDFLVRRAGPRLTTLAEGFRDDAFHYLLFLRLVPLFPFFLVNLAPAIVGVRLPPFLAATALGILPATFAFALAGAGLDSAIDAQVDAYKLCLAEGRSPCAVNFDIRDAVNPKLIAALAGLGLVALVPVVARKIRQRRRRA
jgi:uncharacterized membrane protein YdjX (TVP38/TMEM64 family)